MRKNIYFKILTLCLITVFFVSCENSLELKVPVEEFVSINSIRKMYQGEPVIIKAKNADHRIFISGIVISDYANKNFPEGKIVVQNYENDTLRGIVLSVAGNIGRYLLGDSIIARVDGKILERDSVTHLLQIADLTIKDVGKISSNNTQRVQFETSNFTNILANMPDYESTLVSLLDVQVLNVQKGQKFGDGDLTLSDSVNNNILIRTLPTASFAVLGVADRGNFKGIFLSLDSLPYLMLRNAADYKGIITKPENYTGFPEGWENIIGTRKTNVNTSGYDQYPSGRWYLENAMSNSSTALLHKNGTWAIMMSNINPASIRMEFDLEFGASKFSFYYGAATTQAIDADPITLYPEYSQDGGVTWNPVDPAEPSLVVSSQTEKYFKEYVLNIDGNVRFRIRKDSPSGRLMVDDIFVQPN